jgi:hypothetical protein
MVGDKSHPGSQIVPSSDDVSIAQITALVSGVVSGLEPLAKQQAEVQLRQIDASAEQDARRFRFARTQLFTTAAILVLVIGLLSGAAWFLLAHNHEEDALRLIFFGVGALGGFGVGKMDRRH